MSTDLCHEKMLLESVNIYLSFRNICFTVMSSATSHNDIFVIAALSKFVQSLLHSYCYLIFQQTSVIKRTRLSYCNNISKVDIWEVNCTVYLITIILQFFQMYKAAIANTSVCDVDNDVYMVEYFHLTQLEYSLVSLIHSILFMITGG